MQGSFPDQIVSIEPKNSDLGVHFLRNKKNSKTVEKSNF